ncbi:unnamed protein product [Heligmosomoides polygyrus]|uniref:Reverse transcriptase domain-containing protein n=1 Tax=Heligmosomoides polygyrus TaxID=6339 RepID=A0A183G411_HELPZ|nr:unnamed protein product [Heligmosomoides polygyrus]
MKAVAVAKASHYDYLNEKLETNDSEQLYRLAKARHPQSEDIEKFFGIDDENGHLLMNRRRVMERWNDYFEKISTVEFAYPPIPRIPPTHGLVPKITMDETEAALKKMKLGKATALDDLAADLWKSRCWHHAEWLTKFFDQIVAEKKEPGGWQQSTMIPIWKKGSLGDCTSYRPIRRLSLKMKVKI